MTVGPHGITERDWLPTRLRDLPPASSIDLLSDPLLPKRETTILYGEAGSGKSLLAAAVSVSIASGTPVIPGLKPIQGTILILDFEMAGHAWRERAERLAKGAGLPEIPAGITYVRATDFLADHGRELDRLLGLVQPDLVVVDSTGFALPPAPENADPKDAVLAMFRTINEADVAFLLLDHVAKVGRTLYGSAYKRNAAREIFELKSSDGILTLRHDKASYRQRLDPIHLRPVFEAHGGPIRYTRVSAPTRKTSTGSGTSSVRAQVFELLSGNPGLSNADLKAMTGGTAGAVRKARSDWSRALQEPRE